MQSHGITLAFHPIAPGSAWQNGFTERLIGIDSSLKCASPKTTIWSTHSRRIADCHLHVSLIRIAVITFAQWQKLSERSEDRIAFAKRPMSPQLVIISGISRQDPA